MGAVVLRLVVFFCLGWLVGWGLGGGLTQEGVRIWRFVQVCVVRNHDVAGSAHGYRVSEGKERDVYVA